MKKKLALLLAAVMSLQPLAAISIIAAGESTVEKVYADVYGIEIDFATAEDAAAAQSSIALAEIDGGAAVAVTATVSTDVETKVVVTPDNSELLDVDTPYTLTIGEETKDFQIKTMFYEDFENLTYDTYTGTLPGEDISVSEDFTNKYGNYSLTAGDGSGEEGGAFVRKVNGDTEVGVTDGAFAITDIDTFENLSDATIMADIKGYRKNRSATAVTAAAQVNISMLSRSQTTNNKPYTKASRLTLRNGAFEVGTTGTDAAFALGLSNSGYVNEDAATTFGFGTLVNAGSFVVSKDTAVNGENESNEREIALRTNGTTITGFVSGEAVTYTNASVETTAGDFAIGLTNNGYGLAVIDNVRVTIYTEDLSPAPSGTITEQPTLGGDTTKLTLDFSEELTGIGPVSLDTITVLENDIEVDKEITVDETDKSILNIVPDGLTSDRTYTIIIPNGFGVGDLRVEAAEGFTLIKYIAPTPMAITDKALTPTSINITFDKDISAMTTNESECITVSKKTIGADDSTYESVVYSFSKEGNVLKIVPNTFAVGNTYKVVIAQGYGDANVKITAQTAGEYVVDFEKIEATPTKVSGNIGVVMVEFDQTIPSATSTSGVKIFNAQTGAQMTATATIANGKLNVDFPAMEMGTEYEIFVPENFGTDVVGTKKDFRKKFSQEVVAKEDFEGETVGATIPGAKTASVQADRWDTSNHRGYMSSGTFVFSTNTTYNEDGTVKELGTSEMENLTVEFKHQALFPIRENTGANQKKYGSSFIYDLFKFNKVDDSNYNWLYFDGGMLRLRDKINGTDTYVPATNSTNYTNITLDYEKAGDAYKMSNGTLFVYNEGEAFSSADANYPFTGQVKNISGGDQTTSDMNPKDGNSIKIVKTGNTITVYVKDVSTGEFVKKFGPTTMTSTQKAGSIEYTTQGTNYYSLDDIEITAFKVHEETGIVASAMDVAPTDGDGNWATATTAEGSVTLVNYTADNLDMAVVAVAYGENGKMLSAYYNGDHTGLDAGERSDVTFNLNNLGGKAVSVKVFVWDNTTNRAPMSVYELIDTE